MKITKHITFFYIENRLPYVNAIIDETNTYKMLTDLFIHTNTNEVTIDTFNKYTNGSINIVYHDLSGTHPYYLTWKCRALLKEQKDEYDIFMYVEDDIVVPYKAIVYWLTYSEALLNKKYNLGFLRIETKDTIEYVTDLTSHLTMTFVIDNIMYSVNNKNPYCAFWIYTKKEFNRFVDSKYYAIESIPDYDIREKSAIGLHGIQTCWYKNTVIPLIDKKLHEDCKIFHLPNNYATNKFTPFGKIKFTDVLRL